MPADDFSWLTWLIVFGAGLILGVLITNKLSNKARQSTKVKRQLTEKELELSQVKESVNDHFLRTAEGLANLSKQLNSLQEQLTSDAQTLANETEVTKRLGHFAKPSLEKDAQKLKPETQLNPEEYQPPKDYSANNKGGTLKEDFSHPNFEQPKDYASNSDGGTLAEDFAFNTKLDTKKAENSQAKSVNNQQG